MPEARKRMEVNMASRPSEKDTAYTRRFLALLRDPVAPLVEALADELEVPRPRRMQSVLKIVGGDSRSLLVFRAASWLLVACSQLFIIQDWPAFLLKNQGLSLGLARARFVALMRRRGLKISRSTLYRHASQFERFGLRGLVPQWRVGERARIPEGDRDLMVELLRLGASRNVGDLRGIYLRLRKLKLKSSPVRFAAWRRVVEGLRENEDNCRERERPRKGRK